MTEAGQTDQRNRVGVQRRNIGVGRRYIGANRRYIGVGRRCIGANRRDVRVGRRDVGAKRRCIGASRRCVGVGMDVTDDESMETQLNSMWQKANVLKTLGQPLKDSLITMVILLPSSYSTLWTILMAADDKLMTGAVINQVLIEEKSRKVSSTLSALAMKMTG